MNFWKNLSIEYKVLVVILISILLVGVATCAKASERLVPAVADQYEKNLINAAQAAYGLDAPVARLAALIHVESHWNPQAQSPWAEGLAQFTPLTAEWIAQIRPELGPADPWDPNWSMQAAAQYTKLLYDQIKPFDQELAECDHWAMDLSAYNGGATWLKRDRMLTQFHGSDPDKWFGHTEKHSRRAQWALKENRAYPVKILTVWEHRYLRSGWPGTPACSASV